MKNKIGIAIIALIGILINCFLIAGCVPPPGYITIDSRSALMKPTFCMYKDPYFQERAHIGRITVEKVDRSFQKNRRVLDAVQTKGQTVWELELKYRNAGNFFIRLFQRLLAPPVFCLMYGEVPSGYEEKVKAFPLEPEELYILSVDAASYPRRTAPLRFIIRLNGTGVPDRLEYRLGVPYMSDDIFHLTRSHLILD
jgi:hypothetical protein